MEINKDYSIFNKTIKIYDDLDSDPDNIIQIQESSNMALGTGSRIWECGMILSKYFVKQNFESKISLKNKKILELGGGTGYLSILLGALGANVICTDLKEILLMMKENVDNNKEIIKENKGNVEIRELDWALDKDKIKDILADVEELHYILATDVIFNKGHLTTFSKCLRNIYEILKEKNNGKKFPTTLLCYKSRNDEIDEGIITYLEGVGFDCRQVKEEEMHEEYLNKRVDIFSLLYK